MQSTLLVYIINFFSLFISVGQLCVASSIFDFIVMHRMYYTSHDETVLIEPSQSILFFAGPLVSAFVALLTVILPQLPSAIQNFLARHPFLTAIIHASLLLSCSVAFAFCSLTSAQLSVNVGYYAYNGVPQKFQDASFWYFVRLRTATVLFGIQSIACLSQIALLYMGIECRYRVIAPHPTKKSLISGPL